MSSHASATLIAALCFVSLMTLPACTSKVLKVDQSDQLLKNDEFDKALKVKVIAPTPTPGPGVAAELPESGLFVRLPGPEPVLGAFATSNVDSRNTSKPLVGRSAGKKGSVVEALAPAPAPSATPRQPEIEDAEGFNGRRPVKDPYRVGERVTYEASYFGVVAGDITIEVRPFVQVNGRKSYTFAGTAISTSVFAMFYAVDDWFETHVDFETMTPYSYSLHVKETKQLREARELFDHVNKKASYWDKKINSEGKIEEKKNEWEIPAFPQNVFSAPFYLRAFTLKPGKKIAFTVAHEKENLILTADVIRREKITTDAGEFNTVVLKPMIELNGVFKPMGDVFVWMTDDDRKLIVRIESKIKIGKVVAVAKKVELGTP
jgi:hypothetical protein